MSAPDPEPPAEAVPGGDGCGGGGGGGGEAAADEAVPADEVPFADLCDLLDRLHKKKKDWQEQDKILTSFFDEFRLNAARIPGKKNCSLFPIMRLLLPDCDRERGPYNLKEAKLGALLARVLALGAGSEDARRLTSFRSAAGAGDGDGDFAGVAYFVLKGRLAQARPPPGSALSVRDVNRVLDQMAFAQVGAKGPVLEEAMGSVVRRLSAEQVKWFLRVVLKELRLGMRARRVLAALHPDAPDTYDTCANLLKTCSELEDGATRPPELGVAVFCPVSPMLAERLDVQRAPHLPPAQYCLETKFDGERFQLHMVDGVFEYFSRKGHPYGHQYGRSYAEGEGEGQGEGQLTPRLRGKLAPDVTSLILDGEMMGWHKLNHTYGSKGMSFDVKKLTARSSFQPCYVAFDVLYYNGRALVGAGGARLRERRALLERSVRDAPGDIVCSECTTLHHHGEILEALNAAILNQKEGVVAKDLDSYYLPNRRNAGWYKLKPEYTEGAMVELDLVVIGAEEAADKRHGRARSFHVACVDRAGPARWLCVGRVATGLSHEQRARLCAALEPHWTRRAAAPPPACLVFNREKPDWWLLPEHSVVLQVRATELIRSADYGTSHTLRFPRVVAVRDDKPPGDVMTRAEFDVLVQVQGGGSVVKLSAGPLSAAAPPPAPAPRRKRSAPQVPEHFRKKTLHDVEVVSMALAGREVCVLSEEGEGEGEEPSLVQLVRAHGGRHVENIGPATWCCVAGRRTARVARLVAAGAADVARAGWLRALPAAASTAAPAALGPLDVLAASARTRLAWCGQYDRAGDSYTRPTDEHTLRRCFDKLDEEPPVHLTQREMVELDRELFVSEPPFSFLRGCVLHVPVHVHAGPRVWASAAARVRGARLAAAADPALTHVVLPARAAPPARPARPARHARPARPARRPPVLVVADAWLHDCLLHERRLSETPYLIDTDASDKHDDGHM